MLVCVRMCVCISTLMPVVTVCRGKSHGSWPFLNSPPTHSWKWWSFCWSGSLLSTSTQKPSGLQMLTIFNWTSHYIQSSYSARWSSGIILNISYHGYCKRRWLHVYEVPLWYCVILCNIVSRLFTFTETPSGGKMYKQALDEKYF